MATPIVVAPLKEIIREWRTFVVNGRVVGSSLYAQFGERFRSSEVEERVIQFAQSMVDNWQPAPIFVLDIGEIKDKGLGIIEVNTLNSSGIYEADMRMVYSAIDNFYG